MKQTDHCPLLDGLQLAPALEPELYREIQESLKKRMALMGPPEKNRLIFHHSGTIVTIGNAGAVEDGFDTQEHVATMELSSIEHGDANAIDKFRDEMVESQAKGLTQHLLSSLSEDNPYGTSIDLTIGEDPRPKLKEAIEKVDWGVDSFGKPTPPFFFVHPDMAKELEPWLDRPGQPEDEAISEASEIKFKNAMRYEVSRMGRYFR